MADVQWPSTEDVRVLLPILAGKASERKQRLFAAACCRMVWRELTDEQRQIVEAAELFAEGKASGQDLDTAKNRARDNGSWHDWKSCYERYMYLDRTHDGDRNYRQDISDAEDSCSAAENAYHRYRAVEATTRPNALELACTRYRWEPYTNSGEAVWATPTLGDPRLGIKPCQLIREIFLPPSHPIALNNPFLLSSYQEKYGIAIELCKTVYEECRIPEGSLDGDLLANVASALEALRFPHTEVLEHLRVPGPHFRGCWAVDLILGKR